MPLETHGRWPRVAAAALLPVSAAATRRPALRPLAALLSHQTEEWVWPGGFLPWINREVLSSSQDEFPIDRRAGLLINVVYGWGLSLTPLLGARRAGPAAALYVSHLGNAALHVTWAARHRRYDPGTITSLTTLGPVAIVELKALATDPAVSRRSLAAGIASGLLASASLLPALKRRVRRASAG